MPKRSTVGSTARSMPRARIEYGGCSVCGPAAQRARRPSGPRRSARPGTSTCPRPGSCRRSTRSSSAVDRLGDVGGRIGPVHLVQVDPIGAEPAQAVVDRPHDPAAGVAAPVRVVVVADRIVELGAQHDVVATAGDRLADDLLVLAVGVHVGGVDQVDAGVERSVDDPTARGAIGVAPRAEHHRAQPEPTHVDPGAAERSRFDRSPFSTSDERSRQCRRRPHPWAKIAMPRSVTTNGSDCSSSLLSS